MARKKLGRCATHRVPSNERPPPGTTQWMCGWMGQGLPPSVQNGEAADPGAQPARIGGERRHGVGGGLEQDCIDDSLILEGDLGDRRGQGEDDVEIGNGQEFGLAVRHPLRPRLSLALWTVTIATGVVGDPRDATGVAGFDMPAERRCPACRNRTHHAPLDTSRCAAWARA